MATRKWIPIVVGIVIFVVLVGIGLVAGFAYLVASHVKVETMAPEQGQAEFDRLAAKMAGQTPLIVLPEPGSDADPVVHRELETHDTGSISTVHIRVWSQNEKKLARVDLPFWLIRLGGNKPFTINTGSIDELTLHVTPEEIDRRGPGLILLWTSARHSRLLVWTE